MSTPLLETPENKTSVGALISAAIIGAMIVLVLIGHAAARTQTAQLRGASGVEWSAPEDASDAASAPRGGSDVDSTLVPAGGISR